MVRAVCINRFADIYLWVLTADCWAGCWGSVSTEYTNYIIFYFYERHLCSVCVCVRMYALLVAGVCVCEYAEAEVKKVDAKMPLKIVPSCDTSGISTCFIVDITCMINKFLGGWNANFLRCQAHTRAHMGRWKCLRSRPQIKQKYIRIEWAIKHTQSSHCSLWYIVYLWLRTCCLLTLYCTAHIRDH